MFVDFENLPGDAKIWIYAGNKRFTGNQREWMSEALQEFLEKWTSHGNDLKSGFKVLYDQILVIGLDENAADASGCSIDASVHFIKEIGAHLEVSFFNRNLVPFLHKNNLRLVSLNSLKTKIANGEITGESTIFNTLLAKKSDLNQSVIPLKDSWLNRYLKNEEIST
jgi:hypothetical protein